MRSLLSPLALLLVVLGLRPSHAQEVTPASPASPAAGRPRVGLALGGGAARGMAHIGILEWFEEHRIPVDLIVGTSAGGLVGGAYAAGFTLPELRALMRDADWDLIFLADSPFRYKTFRRKEDARAFPGLIDFGLKGGFKLPSGLNAGQHVQLMLDRIGLPYYDLRSFDDLPIPYRAVASDLRASERVVLDGGSLSMAMRATMALPGVFTPVVAGDQVLVDGGVLDNVPADVVRSLGADVVIAVSVGSGTDEAAAPANLFDVLSQTIDTFMKAGVSSSLKSADLVITPDLKGYAGLDWRRGDAIADQGYRAAEAMAEELRPYQLDAVAYAALQQERLSRGRDIAAPLAFVRVDGVGEATARQIREAFLAGFEGRALDRESLEVAILRLSGTDRYEVIKYRLEGGPDGAGLVVDVTPKSYGPPFLLPAVDLENIDSSTFAASLRLRVASFDTLVANSEIRLDVEVGSTQRVAGEVYRRIGPTRFFVAPRAYFDRRPTNAYDDDDNLFAQYKVKRTGAGGDIGYEFGRSELRAGFDVADVRARRHVGAPVLPEASGTDRFASIRWTFDGQTSPLVPTRGVLARTALRYYFSSPEIVTVGTSETARRFGEYAQAEATVSTFSRRGRNRVFVVASGGTSFGDDPGINEFRLGGAFRLGAYNNDEIRGDNFVLLTAGVLREWFRLPDVLGGGAYYGLWFENGSAFDEWDRARYRADLSAGVVLETLLGPLFFGGSQSLNSGAGRFYLALAPLQR
jgi:NTE family protein